METDIYISHMERFRANWTCVSKLFTGAFAILASIALLQINTTHICFASDVLPCAKALSDLLSNPGDFSRSEFYQLRSRRIKDHLKYSSIHYGNQGPFILEKLKELGDSFESLIVDPGLVIRLDDFSNFVKALPSGKYSSWQARKLYSEYLGKRTVYRGLVLLPEEALEMSATGINSRFFDDEKNQRESLFDQVVEDSGTLNLINDRLEGKLKNSILQSVSDYPDVAIAVANHFGEKREGARLYLVRITAPELDLIHFDGQVFINYKWSSEAWIKSGVALNVKQPNGQVRRYPLSRSIESFVNYRLDKTEIESISEVNPENLYSYSFDSANSSNTSPKNTSLNSGVISYIINKLIHLK